MIEVVVVIAIILLLAALLLPALSMARASAKRVACLQNLRQIHVAAKLHTEEHEGYLPVAGMIVGGANPSGGLADAARSHYVYYDENGTNRPAPLPAALAAYLGQPVPLGSPAQLTNHLSAGVVRKVFTCRADENPRRGVMICDVGGMPWPGIKVWTSYVANEAVLGWDGAPIPTRLRGKLADIQNPSRVMLLADGLWREPGGTGMVPDLMVMSNWAMPAATMGDALAGVSAGWSAQFDYARHRRMINVLFLDGRAESLPITRSRLDEVGLNKWAR